MCADIVALQPFSLSEKAIAAAATPSPDYGTRMVIAFRQMAQYLDMNNRYLLRNADTTMPQLTCLQELNAQGALTIGLLAKRVFLSAASVVGIIDRLEEKKLVTRTRGQVDRRSVFVEITEAGRQLITASPHLLQNRLHDALEKYSEGEKIMMVNSLEMALELLREKDAGLHLENES